MKKLFILLMTVLLVTSVSILSQTSRPGVLTTTRSATGPTTTTTTKSIKINLNTPKALLESVHLSVTARDCDAMARCVEPRFRTYTKQMYKLHFRLNAGLTSLIKVMEKKFDKNTAEKLTRGAIFFGGPSPASPASGAVRNGKIDWRKVKIRIQGNMASYTIGKPPVIWNARKIGSKWYWVSPGIYNTTPEQLKIAVEMSKKTINQAVRLYKELETGVRKGTITKESFEDKAEEIWQKVIRTPVVEPKTKPKGKPAR